LLLAKFTVNTDIFSLYLPPPKSEIFHYLILFINLPLWFTLQQIFILNLHSTAMLLTWKNKSIPRGLLQQQQYFSPSCKSNNITVSGQSCQGKQLSL